LHACFPCSPCRFALCSPWRARSPFTLDIVFVRTVSLICAPTELAIRFHLDGLWEIEAAVFVLELANEMRFHVFRWTACVICLCPLRPALAQLPNLKGWLIRRVGQGATKQGCVSDCGRLGGAPLKGLPTVACHLASCRPSHRAEPQISCASVAMHPAPKSR